MPDPAVRLSSIGHSWGGTAALSGIDFEIDPGEIFGIVGPDGAGKTTLMRILAAVLRPSRGDAWISGRHTVRNPGGVHDITGYVCQTTGLYPDLTVAENIRFASEIRGVPPSERRDRSARLLAATGLGEFTGRRAGALSGGMKQKLALVCSLLHTPEVLILDEPTNGVDPLSRREFWRILSDLAGRGVTVVLATTYLDEAERCDRSCLLSEGRAVDVGTPAAIREGSGLLVIEVTGSPDPASLLTAFRRVPGLAVSLRAGCVRIAFRDPVGPERTLSEARRLAGPGCVVKQSVPTLEDVLAAGAK